MKKLGILFVLVVFLFSPPAVSESGEDKPVEARIVKTYENGKEVEYIEIKLKSGKIIKIYPHLQKEQIPVPRSVLPEHISQRFLTVLSIAVVTLLAGIALVRWAMKKEESP